MVSASACVEKNRCESGRLEGWGSLEASRSGASDGAVGSKNRSRAAARNPGRATSRRCKCRSCLQKITRRLIALDYALLHYHCDADDISISPDKKRTSSQGPASALRVNYCQTEKQAATTPRHRQSASAATVPRSSDTHIRVSRTSALATRHPLALTEHSHTHSSLAVNGG